jgi:hypothetical protein
MTIMAMMPAMMCRATAADCVPRLRERDFLARVGGEEFAVIFVSPMPMS